MSKVIGTVVAFVVGMVMISTGFPFSRRSAAPGTATAASTPRAGVTAPASPPSGRPAAGGPVTPAEGYVCAAVLAGLGATAVRLRCPGAPVRSVAQSAGKVVITFGADLARCAAFATPRLAGSPAGTPAGEISAGIASGPVPDQVTVRTVGQSGQPVVRGFSLALRCPPPAGHGVVVIGYPDRRASAPVPCAIARSGRALATLQDAVPGALESATVTSRGCAVRIVLRSAPHAGHPARVGWLALP